MESYLWLLQMAADVLLIGAVFLLLKRIRQPGQVPQVTTPEQLERFVTEAGELAQEFDRLLNEKRELVNTTLSTLDNRIAQIEELTARAEYVLDHQRAAAPSQPSQPEPGGSMSTAQAERAVLTAPPSNDEPEEPLMSGMGEFRRQVLELSRQGRGAAQIAEVTGRPRGEVELVMGLIGSNLGGD